MTRRRRTPGAGDPWTEALLALAVLGTLGSALALVTWASRAVVSLVSGHGVGPSPLQVVRQMVDDGSLAPLWAGLPATAVLATACTATALLTYAFTVGWFRWSSRHPPRDGFARASQFAELLPGRAGQAKARRLRPSLVRRRRLTPHDQGTPLGRLRRNGPLLRASWEEVVLAICAPRSGKTTCLAIPAVLDAPGPVLATSNKADLWQHTVSLRGEHGQQVWTFDPQAIARTRQEFTWDALAGITSVADARRFAGHFIQEVRRTADAGDFWDRDAEDLLTGLILAAALAGKPLTQVGTWLTAVSSVQPRNILATNGYTQLADAMAGRSQGAVETCEGVYATARAAAACLSDPTIMEWVVPRPGLTSFSPRAFAGSQQTLFLLSKDGAGSAAPLVAAFADRVLLEAVRCAEESPGGRLDPPLTAVLDEAANVCRITELPRLYSHLGSRGLVPITILQSRSQGRRVWGDGGMAELFGAATVKLIGAGVDEQGFAEELSKVIGDEDVLVITRSSGKTGGVSRTTRRERVLAADEVRAMPKFTALLLVTGIRPALLHLVPWMAGPRARDIQAALAERPS